MIMKKNTLFLFAAVLLVTSLSSCGIFGKGCGCPTFGQLKSHSSSPSSLRAIARQSQTVQGKLQGKSA